MTEPTKEQQIKGLIEKLGNITVCVEGQNNYVYEGSLTLESANKIFKAFKSLGYRLPAEQKPLSDGRLGKAILTRVSPIIKDGKFVNEVTQFEVRVMAIAESHAMVRRKGCMPFVCAVKDLTYQVNKDNKE